MNKKKKKGRWRRGSGKAVGFVTRITPSVIRKHPVTPPLLRKGGVTGVILNTRPGSATTTATAAAEVV